MQEEETHSLSIQQTLDVIDKALRHTILVQGYPILLILQPHFATVADEWLSERASTEL